MFTTRFCKINSNDDDFNLLRKFFFFSFQNFDSYNATPAIKELWDVLTDANKQVIQISKMYSKLYQI